MHHPDWTREPWVNESRKQPETYSRGYRPISTHNEPPQGQSGKIEPPKEEERRESDSRFPAFHSAAMVEVINIELQSHFSIDIFRSPAASTVCCAQEYFQYRENCVHAAVTRFY
jgi:hypothetical protein